MVPGGGSSNEVTPLPTDSADRCAGGRPLRRRRLRVRADRELDRGLGAADAGQPRRRARRCRSSPSTPSTWHSPSSSRAGVTAADVQTVAAFPVASAQVRNWLAAQPARRPARARQLQRRRGQRRRGGPRRRGRQHRAGRAALRPERAGRRCRRRTQRQDPVRARRPAGTAAAAHRRRPHVGGAAARQRARCAGRGDDRVRRSATST